MHNIEEFRTSRGKVGGTYEGARTLLLTTTDPVTGDPRTTLLRYLHDKGERTLIIASGDGTADPPTWYHHLGERTRVTVETGIFTYEAEAVELHGSERDEVVARATEADPALATEQARATRPIPVIALEPIGGGPNGESWGEVLQLIHEAFRRELALIRKEVAESGPGIGAQLRINCLSLCQGLHYHHTGEDVQMFPTVERQHPELGEMVARLRREHESIEQLLQELHRLLSTNDADPSDLAAEVERLTTRVKAHLDYEEEQLIPILDALTP